MVEVLPQNSAASNQAGHSLQNLARAQLAAASFQIIRQESPLPVASPRSASDVPVNLQKIPDLLGEEPQQADCQTSEIGRAHV